MSSGGILLAWHHRASLEFSKVTVLGPSNVPLVLCGVAARKAQGTAREGSRGPPVCPSTPRSPGLRLPRGLESQRQSPKTRPGQAFKNVLAAGPTRKSISCFQPAALPSPGPSWGCCDSKTKCHGNDCATPGCLESRAAALSWVGAASICPPPIPLGILLCLAWAAFGLRSASFAGRPASSLPLFAPRGSPAGSHAPILAAAIQPLLLPKVRPRGPSWRPGTPGSGHLSWPGASLCKHSVCIPGLVRALPASGASLWFQAFLGAENRNQPCVFQAARLLRNSCLSPEIPCSRSPPAPFREEGTCSPQAGFLSLLMKGKFLGKIFGPIRSGPSLWSRDPLPPQSRSCLMSERRSWGPCRGLLPPDCGQDHPGKSFLNSDSRSQPWGNCCPEGAARRSGIPSVGLLLGAGRKESNPLKVIPAEIGVTEKVRAPSCGCLQFPRGLIHADGSLREKWAGMFSRRGCHL